MRLTWMGTAALLLESGGTILAFDPFPGLPERGPLGFAGAVPDAETFRKATHVLATHGHFDHIMAIPALYRDAECPVYLTGTPRRTLAGLGFPPERLLSIGPGKDLEAGAFRVRAWQGRHCRFDVPLVLKTVCSRRALSRPGRLLRMERLNRAYPENGETLFYEVTDGRGRLQIMGSMGLDEKTCYPTGADWLVMPFQGRSDMPEYALPLAERLAPKEILLDHWDDAFPPMSGRIDTGPFEKLVARRLGIPCRALRKYETLLLETKRRKEDGADE